MKTHRSIKKGLIYNPYFIIAAAAAFAYLPISTMLFSLKNDVVAIEYPIQHFISQCLRNGEYPTWLNTWSMGFPLQSVLSWSVYSTPTMVSGFLVEWNLYVLNAEFLLFIMASGWCMYKLLKTHIVNDRNLSLLLACCYMLSGFTVGSSQWLLYITGMTFIPLVLYFLISLMKKPSLKYVLLLGVSYYLFFTNSHIYLTVVSTYLLAGCLAIYLVRLILNKDKNLREKLTLLSYLFLSLCFTLALCWAPIYYSFEVISYLKRSVPLAIDSHFFQSNYLHPAAMSSLLFPLSIIKTSHINTEATVLNTYIGLLPLILLPASFLINKKQKNKTPWILLVGSILLLVVAFGHITPLRNWLNILPGMSHFRHPGVLRIFFNFAFIVYLAVSFKNHSLSDLLGANTRERKTIITSIISLLLFSLIIFLFHSGNFSGAWKGSFYQSIKNITGGELLLISSAIQLLLLALILIFIRKPNLFSFFIIAELVINTLICTPFLTISGYSPKEVNKIFQTPDGFPIQEGSPLNTPSTETDERNNSWYNINTFRKEVSSTLSMPGPLILDKVSVFLENTNLHRSIVSKSLVFINDTSAGLPDSLQITEQLPAKVTVEVILSVPREVVLQQATFPGWNIFYNNSDLSPSKNNLPFVSAIVPAGRGTLVFRFNKEGVIFSSILLHIIVLITLSFYTIKKIIIRPSSLS